MTTETPLPMRFPGEPDLAMGVMLIAVEAMRLAYGNLVLMVDGDVEITRQALDETEAFCIDAAVKAAPLLEFAEKVGPPARTEALVRAARQACRELFAQTRAENARSGARL